jgi:hypothetical protein
MARMLAIRLLIALALLAGLLFAAAGGWQIPAIWAYLGLCFCFAVLILLTVDRRLLRERLSGGTKRAGRYFRALLARFALAHLVVAGRDVGRFKRSATSSVLQIKSHTQSMNFPYRASGVQKYRRSWPAEPRACVGNRGLWPRRLYDAAKKRWASSSLWAIGRISCSRAVRITDSTSWCGLSSTIFAPLRFSPL